MRPSSLSEKLPAVPVKILTVPHAVIIFGWCVAEVRDAQRGLRVLCGIVNHNLGSVAYYAHGYDRDVLIDWVGVSNWGVQSAHCISQVMGCIGLVDSAVVALGPLKSPPGRPAVAV